jgi:hypothetical protein
MRPASSLGTDLSRILNRLLIRPKALRRRGLVTDSGLVAELVTEVYPGSF